MPPSPENLLTPYPRRDARAGGGWFDLDDWVGPQHPSGRADVAKLEAILANSGDYSLERTQGPTGYWGLALDDGIRRYQKRNGLEVDGILRPGGPTISHLRENFSALFDGYEPPTPEDIDAHHEIVSDDDPGMIAWRDPPATFGNVANLPEIDQETDASNARLARAMAKTGDYRGYAPLLARAIEDSGLSGVAAVNDAIEKFDALVPGKGGLLASAVQKASAPDTLKALGLEPQAAPPKGTKVAFTDTLADALMLGGAIGIGAAAKHGFDETARVIGKTDEFKLPGFTPADNENKPAQTPPPALLDVPIHTGHPVEQPTASDSIETYPADSGAAPSTTSLPPLQADERKQLVGKFLDHFAIEYRYLDGSDDRRGKPKTVELNNVTARACQKAIEESKFPELIKQLGGSSEGGREEEYMPEKRLTSADGETSQADYLMGVTDENENIKHAAAINTATTRADGTPTLREQSQLDRLVRNKVVEFVDWLRKVGDDENPNDSFDDAYRKCVKGVRRLEAKIEAEIEERRKKGGE